MDCGLRGFGVIDIEKESQFTDFFSPLVLLCYKGFIIFTVRIPKPFCLEKGFDVLKNETKKHIL